MADSPLPVLLAASGVAAEFCARPEIWPLFEDFLTEGMEGIPDGNVNREFLHLSSAVILLLVQGMEREMIADKFSDLLAGSLFASSVPTIYNAGEERRGPGTSPAPLN